MSTDYLFSSELHTGLQLILILALGLFALVLIKKSQQNISKNFSKSALAGIQILVTALRVVVLLVTAITALATLGINVSTLLAGLGLSGFALSFAAKDILANLLSGILLLIYRPFKLHQIIEVDAFRGEVTNMDLKYVTLQQTDASIIVIPNSIILSKIVVIHPNIQRKP
jgi:small conductance mechanosensitive channel